MKNYVDKKCHKIKQKHTGIGSRGKIRVLRTESGNVMGIIGLTGEEKEREEGKQ